MYGLPDSAILGTAKRLRRVVKGSHPRIRKTNKELQDREAPFWDAVASMLDRYADKREAKQERKKLEKKHKVKFI